jgi:hypothetical protein
MSEKGSTLRRGPSLSCELEQRLEGRLMIAAPNGGRGHALGESRAR